MAATIDRLPFTGDDEAAERAARPAPAYVPVLGRIYAAPDSPRADDTPVAALTLPYGVALSLGSLLTLGILRWS